MPEQTDSQPWLRVGGELHAAPTPSQRRWRYLDLTAAGRKALADA